MKARLPRKPWLHWIFAAGAAVIVVLTITAWVADRVASLEQQVTGTKQEKDKLLTEFAKLQSEDQYRKNQQLSSEIGSIEATYTQAVSVYEDLLRFREITKASGKFDDRFSNILSVLAKRDFTGAAAKLSSLKNDIQNERNKIAATFVIPSSAIQSNAPPTAGSYSAQTVTSDAGQFYVQIIAADLGSTRVYVDTASTATCTNDCPTLPLSTYVSRNGAYAGVNGSYFCPASYPSCAGKTNSFDTLLMNRNKVYFNSDNNTYSTVPAVIFGNGFIRFVGRSLEWGRDTSIDSMIAMQPLLVSGGSVVFGGNSDPKEGAKGSRSFIANRGNTVYIGVVFNATVAESARVMKAMGMDNALNLDDGGSVALWYGGPASQGGYKAGPGRDIPNAVIFVRK